MGSNPATPTISKVHYLSENGAMRGARANTCPSDHEREKIIDAWREGEAFVVKSPTFETLRVPLCDIPRISAAPEETVDRFEIDEHGDFVYWPDLNVHMGWPEFEQIADPARRFRADQKSAEFNRRYGRAIRRLREQSNLAQNAIEGLDERTVRRIEKGLTRATVNAIRKLAAAHGMKPDDYASRVAELLEQHPHKGGDGPKHSE